MNSIGRRPEPDIAGLRSAVTGTRAVVEPWKPVGMALEEWETLNSEYGSREDHGNDMRCALCGTPLAGSNASREHVIPNALGGRKTVQNFICANCNSRTGADWDSVLVRQLGPLCTMLNVDRNRGQNRSMEVKTLSGKGLCIDPDGTMTIRHAHPFKRQEHDGRIEVRIRAGTANEMRKMVSQLARKYPQVDVEEVMRKAEATKEYSRDPFAVPLEVGGLLAGRSIVKSCLAMAYDAGLTMSDCKEAGPFFWTAESHASGSIADRTWSETGRKARSFTAFMCAETLKRGSCSATRSISAAGSLPCACPGATTGSHSRTATRSIRSREGN